MGLIGSSGLDVECVDHYQFSVSSFPTADRAAFLVSLFPALSDTRLLTHALSLYLFTCSKANR